MSVRLVSKSDFDTLMDMMVAMRSESPTLQQVVVDRERTKDRLTGMYDNNVLIGVMSDHGCMLGIIGANWYSDRIEAFEQMLYVKPEKRGTALAVRLIRAFEDECRVWGAKSIHVGSSTGIADDRTAALYERLGYTRSGISLGRDLNV